MNDKDVLIEMFTRNGIKFTQSGDLLEIEAGYTCFVSEFHFDAEGKLISVGAYE